MISDYLLAFNSENVQYTASDSLIAYLDDKHQDWRNLISAPEEFIEFFKTDVHVFQNDWLRKLADEIFDIVSDNQLIELVWKDTTLNEWYRYAAIRRLIAMTPDTYLPLYIKELISGGFNLGGWGIGMVSELYDFPNSVKIVIESKKFDGNNFEFLAIKACECWEEYPQELRAKILKERDYFMRKDGNNTMWNMMALEEKLYLTNNIIANEYAKFHDVITFANFLNDRDERLHVNHDFACPEYNIETHQYTPSEQIQRFLSIAQEDSNDMAYELLDQTIRKLRHSAHPTFGNH